MKKGCDMFSLVGMTALVTGATGHLGRAMTFALAEAGANVLVNSRSQKRSVQLVDELAAMGLSAAPAAFDITSEEAVGQYMSARAGTPLHILVNNAYAGGAGSIESSEGSAYGSSYDVTLTAAHNLLRAALPGLRKAVRQTGNASVINLASMYALVSPDQRIYASAEGVNPPFYGAAKAALLYWTRYAACEFGKEGIRVNAISPGPFPADAVQVSAPNFIKMLSAKVPMGRIGLPDEIKSPVLFLAAPASSYVNGANIVVDGGWTCW